MANNKEVNLTRRVRVDGKDLYAPVVYAANGRIRADYVLIKDKPTYLPGGAFYLDWYEGKVRHRQSVGTDPAQAAAKRHMQEGSLRAKSAGVENVQMLPRAASKNGKLLGDAVDTYLYETKISKKPKTLAAYRTALEYFLESCKQPTVEGITRGDMLKFAAFLRNEKEQAPRSCWNKFSNVMSFLKAQGVRELMKINDWPKFTEEEPEVYEQEELDNLFAVCDAEERLWFEFFLMTGMREQEVMHTYWRDINFVGSTVKVSHKPDRGWTPKMYKERSIPIPTKLANSLKEWKKQKADKNCDVVFSTKGCNVKMNFLDDLKAVAERAKLKPENFWLHKFRATFATRCLWAGVDLRTVQQWLGHSDLESTMRYLKPSRSQAVHEKVNAIFGSGSV
jgi:integrase/recombinase XerD